ncbi:MAG: carboxypeptidase-like regulatory domain-containing protein, partial [Ignavibacteria bacterium]|nr:carboxypeptidase-like regulatory domain-containing protein [Ignavibacteria bacterium]
MRSTIVFIFISLFISANAQQLIIKGTVTDHNTNKPLSFANIRVFGSNLGSAANIVGEYELKIPKGTYKLIASYIGYYSDTLEVYLEQNLYDINFSLIQTKVDL